MRIEEIQTENYSTEDLKYMFRLFGATAVTLNDETIKDHWLRIDENNKVNIDRVFRKGIK